MAPHGPPFDFDLNEPPPPENDGVNGISAAPELEPSAQKNPLLAEPVPELSDALPPAPVPEPTTAHVPLPARSLAPVPKASPDERPLPAPLRAPVPVPSPPSPVLDLEAPLSPLDDEDEGEADLPLPPPPPLPLPPPPPPPPSWYRVDTSSDALTVSSSRQGDQAARQYSSPETWAPRGSMAAASDTTSCHRSRRRRPYYSCDDAISKQRRVDYDEDGGGSSSRSGSRRSGFGSPRRYERSGPAPPRRYYEQDGGRHAAAADGQAGAPASARSRRRRRRAQRPQHGYHQYEGPVQKQQQGFRGQERPQVHHGPNHGPEVPKVGYASSSPLSGSSFVRRDSSSGGVRLSPEQERGNDGWSHRQCREKDAPAPPFRPSSRPHGREDSSYHGRQSQAQEPPPKIGGYQHRRDREAPSFRPSGWDVSPGGRRIPEEKTITGGAHDQQTKAPPRGRDEHLFPDRAYHPYARHGGSDSDGGGRNPARREPRDSYERRRYSNSKQPRSGGPAPARGRQYYGDVQE